jgi:hypothetical protein
MPIGYPQARPMSRWGRILSIAPLIAVPVLIYNLIALFAGSAPEGAVGVPPAEAALAGTVLNMAMLSGARLVLTWGDLLLVLAIIFLFAEVLKSTGTGAGAITNHMLSMGLFVVCMIEFLLFANFRHLRLLPDDRDRSARRAGGHGGLDRLGAARLRSRRGLQLLGTAPLWGER